MIEHPIIFSGPMVRAILEGRKTMTRRVMKNKIALEWLEPGNFSPKFVSLPENGFCPCIPGDQLWVRETFRFDTNDKEETITYRADNTVHHVQDNAGLLIEKDFGKWKPSIHMPRWASRITLEVTAVRVERLQDISTSDCEYEGITGLSLPSPIRGQPYDEYRNGDGLIYTEPIKAFSSLWDSINSKKYPWSSNPWVWVISFKVVKK